MNEYCDLTPAERDLLALVRSGADFGVTITRLRGVSTVKRVTIADSSFVEGQAAGFDEAWSIATEPPERRPFAVIDGGRGDGRGDS